MTLSNVIRSVGTQSRETLRSGGFANRVFSFTTEGKLVAK